MTAREVYEGWRRTEIGPHLARFGFRDRRLEYDVERDGNVGIAWLEITASTRGRIEFVPQVGIVYRRLDKLNAEQTHGLPIRRISRRSVLLQQSVGNLIGNAAVYWGINSDARASYLRELGEEVRAALDLGLAWLWDMLPDAALRDAWLAEIEVLDRSTRLLLLHLVREIGPAELIPEIEAMLDAPVVRYMSRALSPDALQMVGLDPASVVGPGPFIDMFGHHWRWEEDRGTIRAARPSA